MCGEHGSDQRTGAGDCGEVVAEEDPFVCGVIVAAVAEPMGRSGAAVVQHRDTGGQERAVISVRDRERGEGSEDKPEGVQSGKSEGWLFTC